MNRTGMSVLTVTMSVLVISGCTGQPESKAGGDAVPISLRIGTDDSPGRPAADQITEFARQVSEMSNGEVTIVPVWKADGHDHRGWDQLVAGMVEKGDLDMGLIPSRAWDTEGVTSLRALQAPFLITTAEQANQVATAEVAGEMLAGLDKAGVVGLALFPEGLRQIFSFGQPVLTPSDLKGMTVRAPRSETTTALFEALGATTDDAPGDAFGAGIADGTIGAAESSLAFATDLPTLGTMTGNLILFPKINALVINDDKFAALTDGQRQVLQEAAAKTRDWAVSAVAPNAEQAQKYCDFGGTIVVTSPQNLAAFMTAAQPVYDALEQDPLTKAAIAEIRTLIGASPAASPIAPCTPGVMTPDTETAGSDDAPAAPVPTTFPEGVYRTTMDAQTLIDGGIDPGLANGVAGLNTMTFVNGRWQGDDPGVTCTGTYSVEDGRVVVTGDTCEPGNVIFRATWTLDGTQLRFTDFSTSGDPAFAETYWGSWVWEKVG